MGTDAPTIVFIPVHCAPQEGPLSQVWQIGQTKTDMYP